MCISDKKTYEGLDKTDGINPLNEEKSGPNVDNVWFQSFKKVNGK